MNESDDMVLEYLFSMNLYDLQQSRLAEFLLTPMDSSDCKALV